MLLEISFNEKDPEAMNAYAFLKDLGRQRSKIVIFLVNLLHKQYPDIGQDRTKIEFLATGLQCGLISINSPHSDFPMTQAVNSGNMRQKPETHDRIHSPGSRSKPSGQKTPEKTETVDIGKNEPMDQDPAAEPIEPTESACDKEVLEKLGITEYELALFDKLESYLP